MQRTALIIVDVQNDFVEGGSLAVDGGTAVAERINEHLKTATYDEIITTQDWHKDPGTHWSDTPDYTDTWPVHCAADTFGAEVHATLQEATRNATRILKGEYIAAYSGFEGHVADTDTTLEDHLNAQGITDVVVVGIATDHCVFQTARDAANARFNTTVITAFTAGVDAARSTAAVNTLAEMGVHIQ